MKNKAGVCRVLLQFETVCEGISILLWILVLALTPGTPDAVQITYSRSSTASTETPFYSSPTSVTQICRIFEHYESLQELSLWLKTHSFAIQGYVTMCHHLVRYIPDLTHLPTGRHVSNLSRNGIPKINSYR